MSLLNFDAIFTLMQDAAKGAFSSLQIKERLAKEGIVDPTDKKKSSKLEVFCEQLQAKLSEIEYVNPKYLNIEALKKDTQKILGTIPEKISTAMEEADLRRDLSEDEMGDAVNEIVRDVCIDEAPKILKLWCPLVYSRSDTDTIWDAEHVVNEILFDLFVESGTKYWSVD